MQLRYSPGLLSHIQGFYPKVFGGLHGKLDGLWIDQGPSGKPATDAGDI